MSDEQPEPAAQKQLGLWDTVSIIIGIVIGAGVYETAPFILQNVPNAAVGIGVWVLGGVLSLIGALCYAELASTYPRSGGDYVYLTRAFAPSVGFLFGWAQLSVILTGSIGMMAYVFADYAVVLFDLGQGVTWMYACGAVAVLSVANIAGAVTGKITQNVLTGLKILGLTAIFVAGLFFGSGATIEAPSAVTGSGSLGLAMILVLYTYGGWNDAAFVAAEMRDPKRNIPRALLLGTGAITLIYVAINLAYIVGLGFEGARSSRAIAADVLGLSFGDAGKKLMSVVVMISALGAVNGLIYTGSRIYASMGGDHSVFQRLGRWHPRLGTPVWSLAAQGVFALVLVIVVGTTFGQGAIDGFLTSLGLSPAKWQGHGGFDTLLKCTAPVFWMFFLLTGISLFVLRRRDRDLPRAFSVPLYPVVPLLFCATSLYMLYSATTYAGSLTLVGLLPLLLGAPLYFASSRRSSSEVPDEPT